jgi:hypothetical protein
MPTSGKKTPGLLRDPWRSAVPAAPAPSRQVEAQEPPEVDAEDIDNNETHAATATIELKGYGGITVTGTDHIQAAAVRLLEFCVAHRKEIEPTFTEFGLVIAQLPVQKSTNLKFYIQRGDGWMLAVPNARTRDEGCFQLIQAMMRLYFDPELKKKLESFKIRPYKM